MLLAKTRMATGMLSELVASPKPSFPSSEEPHIHLGHEGHEGLMGENSKMENKELP